MAPSSPPTPPLSPAPLPTNLSSLCTALSTPKHPTSALLSLYTSVHSTLPSTILSRSAPHLTHADLVQIMDCKLTFGQNRPALRGMIAALPPTSVSDASRLAFAALSSRSGSARERVEGAMTELCKLRGVGPATASLILSLVSEEVCFMSDEAAVEVLKPAGGRKGLKYTIKEYWVFWEGVGERVGDGDGEGGRRGWERACWARMVGGDGDGEDGEKGTKKRGRKEVEEKEEKVEEEGEEKEKGGRAKRARKVKGT